MVFAVPLSAPVVHILNLFSLLPYSASLCLALDYLYLSFRIAESILKRIWQIRFPRKQTFYLNMLKTKVSINKFEGHQTQFRKSPLCCSGNDQCLHPVPIATVTYQVFSGQDSMNIFSSADQKSGSWISRAEIRERAGDSSKWTCSLSLSTKSRCIPEGLCVRGKRSVNLIVRYRDLTGRVWQRLLVLSEGNKCSKESVALHHGLGQHGETWVQMPVS